MNPKLISKYRAQLMGIAILMVALFHGKMKHSNSVVDFLCFSGDMGVDFFFFLSGLGMYYSLLKRPTLVNFMVKRIVRIVPAWFIVNFYIQLKNVGFDFDKIEIFEILKYLTGMSFVLEGSLYFWYVPAQLIFYLITPFFVQKYCQSKKKAICIYSFVWIGLLALCVIFQNAGYFIFLFRWPLYFIGIMFGELSCKEIKITKKKMYLSLLVLGVGAFIVNYIRLNNGMKLVRYEYKYFVYMFVVIPLCIWISYLMNKTKYEFIVLKFLGGITLEIYLLHEFILREITYRVSKIPFDEDGWVFNILVFMGVICCAWILHQCVLLFIKIFEIKKKDIRKE